MPLAAETPLFSPGGRVTLTALKWSGTSVTVGSLVAATTVRVIAGGAGAVCAAPEAGSAIAPSSSSSVVLNCMIASQVQRKIAAPYALPAPLGMVGGLELLLAGHRANRFRSPQADRLRRPLRGIRPRIVKAERNRVRGRRGQ